jgi:hypothetical protein
MDGAVVDAVGSVVAGSVGGAVVDVDGSVVANPVGGVNVGLVGGVVVGGAVVDVDGPVVAGAVVEGSVDVVEACVVEASVDAVGAGFVAAVVDGVPLCWASWATMRRTAAPCAYVGLGVVVVVNSVEGAVAVDEPPLEAALAISRPAPTSTPPTTVGMSTCAHRGSSRKR